MEGDVGLSGAESILKFKECGWRTYRHCYLSFTGRGWEEMLLTAGVPEDTERGQSI